VQSINGKSFTDSGLREISIDPANPFFHVSGSFIMDSSDLTIIWYFGTDTNVTIGSDIEKLCCGCFACCRRLCKVDFAPMSKLSEIEHDAFRECAVLQSMTIPAGVTNGRRLLS
jgi:hypothetical protein